MELLQVCLVVNQGVLNQVLGEGALVQMFYWYAREKWGSQFSLVACEDCLEVCFVGLVAERIVYSALSQLSYLWDLDKQEQKGVGNA